MQQTTLATSQLGRTGLEITAANLDLTPDDLAEIAAA